jgi:glutathionyl-hydroquinone reductase
MHFWFEHMKDDYTKSHHDINPKAITPTWPVPNVEEGWEDDLRKLRAGGVKLKAVHDW